MPKQTKYVIIGNSHAAVGCIEGIRSVTSKGEITVISRENYPVYGRPLISYLLCGRTDEKRMQYRPDDFYEKNGAKLLTGIAATAIDPEAKTVALSDGETISYDKLLIATGSEPFIPAMDGLDKVENRFTFLDLDTAKALAAALTPESRVLIIGAGLIGLKCAEGIYERCASITVVDMANRILPSILDETGSGMMQEYLESKGLKFYLNDSVSSFSGNTATLRSGEQVPFDMVVVAVGVRPSTALAEAAGIAVNRGICTGNDSATSVPGIYAAGDCARSHDISSDTDRVLALLPNAYLQGYTAGVNMAGKKASFDNAIPMNSIGFFDRHLVTAGSYEGEAVVSQKDGCYKKMFLKDNLLKGFIIIGDISRAGIYTSLIRDKVPLNSIELEKMLEQPRLSAFPEAVRVEKLGGKKA